MGNYLLEDWSKVWTQELDQGMPLQLWSKLKQLIVLNKRAKKGREKISQEDAKRGIKALRSGTAVGIHQKSFLRKLIFFSAAQLSSGWLLDVRGWNFFF